MDALLSSPAWLRVENWPLSIAIGGTWLFPLLESVHVIAAAMTVGAVLWVDLRLLGLAAGRYAVSMLNRELAPWAWGAFALAAVTGLGMFITRAASHVINPAFQWKVLLLALAGANMAWFHFGLRRSIGPWDRTPATPVRLKAAGGISLLLWVGVTLAGRWIGHIA